MSEQEKPDANLNLFEIFSRISSAYDSGDLEKINVQVDCGFKNPKYSELKSAYGELKKSSVPLEVVEKLVEALRFYRSHADCRSNKILVCKCSFCTNEDQHRLSFRIFEEWQRVKNEAGV